MAPRVTGASLQRRPCYDQTAHHVRRRGLQVERDPNDVVTVLGAIVVDLTAD